MVQQSTSYAPFFYLDKSRSYDVIIPHIYWNILWKLPTAMINIHTKNQVDSCDGRVLFLHHKKRLQPKKVKKTSSPLHVYNTYSMVKHNWSSEKNYWCLYIKKQVNHGRPRRYYILGVNCFFKKKKNRFFFSKFFFSKKKIKKKHSKKNHQKKTLFFFFRNNFFLKKTN